MRRPLLLAIWLLLDYLLFNGAYALAYFLRVGWILSSDLPLWDYMVVVALSGVPWLLILIATRTFGLTRNQRTARNVTFILYAAVVGVALVTSGYFFLFQKIFSRMLMLEALILSVVATCIAHAVMGLLMRILLRAGAPTYPTLIVGVTRESKHLIELLERRRHPLRPVAILDGTGVKESHICGVPVLGKLNKLDDVLGGMNITHLIQCSEIEQSINLIGACRSRGITYIQLPSILGIVEHDDSIEPLEGKQVMIVSPRRGWWDRFFR